MYRFTSAGTTTLPRKRSTSGRNFLVSVSALGVLSARVSMGILWEQRRFVVRYQPKGVSRRSTPLDQKAQMPPANYKEVLKAGNRPGYEFRVVVGNLQNVRHCLLVAPHGGEIEPMTSEITLAVAGVSTRAFYLFEGMLHRRNWERLHMDSTTFDEPDFVALIPETDCIFSFHGAERDKTRTIYVGGLHEKGRRQIAEALNGDLNPYGITAVDATRSKDTRTIAGLSPHNLTNRGRAGPGVQLEFSEGARLVFFPGKSRTERQRPNANLGVLARSVDRVLGGLTGFPQVADVAP
jgi:phage replication-related protein YjqB (UPF0714/DUF867 family)